MTFGAVLALVLSAVPAHAEIQIPLSIKVILGTGDIWPDNPTANFGAGVNVNLNSEQQIRDNIAFTNRILIEKGEPFRFTIYANTIYTISGQTSFYSKDARSATTRNEVEDAALADKTTWKWHDNAVNIYINDSSSGYCSNPDGSRSAIIVGAGAYDTLIYHECGHFLGLDHTHINDSSWGDGDGFPETLPDDSNATVAQINAQYPGETQTTRDNLIFNVMSYHIPKDRLVWDQRTEIIEVVNDERDAQATGEGFFLSSDGFDEILGIPRSGRTYGQRLGTLENAVSKSTSSADVILIQGTIEVTDNTVFSTPHVWMKWRTNALLR